MPSRRETPWAPGHVSSASDGCVTNPCPPPPRRKEASSFCKAQTGRALGPATFAKVQEEVSLRKLQGRRGSK